MHLFFSCICTEYHYLKYTLNYLSCSAEGETYQTNSPLQIIESFLEALTNADKDGRIVVNKQGVKVCNKICHNHENDFFESIIAVSSDKYAVSNWSWSMYYIKIIICTRRNFSHQQGMSPHFVFAFWLDWIHVYRYHKSLYIIPFHRSTQLLQFKVPSVKPSSAFYEHCEGSQGCCCCWRNNATCKYKIHYL